LTLLAPLFSVTTAADQAKLPTWVPLYVAVPVDEATWTPAMMKVLSPAGSVFVHGDDGPVGVFDADATPTHSSLAWVVVAVALEVQDDPEPLFVDDLSSSDDGVDVDSSPETSQATADMSDAAPLSVMVMLVWPPAQLGSAQMAHDWNGVTETALASWPKLPAAPPSRTDETVLAVDSKWLIATTTVLPAVVPAPKVTVSVLPLVVTFALAV
jgi:hypothetical protein